MRTTARSLPEGFPCTERKSSSMGCAWALLRAFVGHQAAAPWRGGLRCIFFEGRNQRRKRGGGGALRKERKEARVREGRWVRL